MIRAFKFKIKPNTHQKELLSQFFGCTRFIYNWGLNLKTSAYKEHGERITYLELAKQLTVLKHQEEYNWLNDCPNVGLQQSLRCLDNAFTAFFRKKAKYPRYKDKRKSKDAIKFISSVHFNFEDWKVKLPKLGWVKMCKNKAFDKSVCKQGTCTVSRDHCGTYWCSITVDDQQPCPAKAKLDKANAVGVDLGIKDYAILSDGTKFSNPKYLVNSHKKLKRLQQKFSRTVKDSKRHEAMRIKVARCYRNITNRRTNFIHQLSSHLVKRFDTICLEDLNVKGMEQNHHLARAIQDAAWSEFTRQLAYKSEWNGKNVLFIGRFEPSSKLCHKCGYVNSDLKLSNREWVCPVCGTVHDRDVNAAMNIREIAFDKQNLVGA